jgi:dCMP deaminase
MSLRESLDEYFMKIAHIVASRSTCIKRKVGAVIVKDKHIVSTGYNNPSCGLANCTAANCQLNSEGKCIKAVHAEINALIQASPEEMKDATIYITCSPCSNCQLAIMNSGITRVVYDEYHQAKVDWIKGKILCEQIHTNKRKEIIDIQDTVNNSSKDLLSKDLPFKDLTIKYESAPELHEYSVIPPQKEITNSVDPKKVIDNTLKHVSKTNLF